MNFLDDSLQDIPDIKPQASVPQPPQERFRITQYIGNIWANRPKLRFSGTKRKYIFISGIICVIVLYILGLGISGLFLRSAISAVEDSKASASQATQALSRMDFAETSVTTKQAVRYLSEAQLNIHRAWLLKTVPWVGTQVQAMEKLVDASVTSAEGALKVANWISEMPFAMTANEAQTLSSEDRKMAFGKMIELPTLVTELNTKIVQSERILGTLPKQGVMYSLQDAGTRLKDQLAMLKQILAPYVPIADIMPQVVDSGEDKAYLWMLFNNDELRPTGGYISAYAITVFRNGRLEEFITDNSRNLDTGIQTTGVQAPEPISKYDVDHNKGKVLLFHDSGWSPDYPSAANLMEQLFIEQNMQQRHKISQFSGIFAMTPTFVAKFLELTGPITIADYTITAKNIADVLEIDSHRGFRERNLSEEDRKQLIFDLGLAMIKKLGEKPLVEWPKMVATFESGLQERHMLVLHRDTEVQKKVSAQRYDGAIRQTASDYLQVVDANLGSFKSDIGIERSINYSVKQTNAGIKATVKVTYENKNTLIWKTTKVYTDYSRIYVPAGSKFIKVSGIEGTMKQEQEANKTVFGGLVRVPIAHNKVIIWEYILPYRVISPSYTLLIQKQAGTKAIPVTIDITLSRQEPLKVKSRLNIDREFRLAK